MFGGLLHNTPVLNELFPNFWNQAPLERHVYKKNLSFMTPRSAVSLAFETDNFEETPYNGYTVMRPVFDSWLAEQAASLGPGQRPGEAAAELQAVSPGLANSCVSPVTSASNARHFSGTAAARGPGGWQIAQRHGCIAVAVAGEGC